VKVLLFARPAPRHGHAPPRRNDARHVVAGQAPDGGSLASKTGRKQVLTARIALGCFVVAVVLGLIAAQCPSPARAAPSREDAMRQAGESPATTSQLGPRGAAHDPGANTPRALGDSAPLRSDGGTADAPASTSGAAQRRAGSIPAPSTSISTRAAHVAHVESGDESEREDAAPVRVASSPAQDLLADLDALAARVERLDGRRMLARDAAAFAPEACLTGVASVTFRGSEVLARCRPAPRIPVAPLPAPSSLPGGSRVPAEHGQRSDQAHDAGRGAAAEDAASAAPVTSGGPR
jgi:hypothetical protein